MPFHLSQLPFVLLLLTIGSLTALADPPSAPPNIVFILADDLGWSDTTLYGHTTFYRTPNLERLAKRGMTFTRAYSASPLCSPTRSAILTGLSPARTGITAPVCHVPNIILEASVQARGAKDQMVCMPASVTRLSPKYQTLAKSLKEAGYATGHFGKWHLGAKPYSPLQHGFDVDVPHHAGPGPAGSYVAPWKFQSFDHDPQVPDQHIEDRMAHEAVEWITKQQGKPFFLNYWMFSVHAPFDAKQALIEKYRTSVDPRSPQRSPTYAAMVESMDDAVGTLLDALDRLKLADNTILVFTSDNGGNMYNEIDGTTPTSNRPLRGGKATMFEGGTRVPAVIVWPGITKPESRSDTPIQSEDYYPTLLAGLGLSAKPNQQFDGMSILPALRGESVSERPLFQFFPHQPGVPDWIPPSISVHHGDWKLIRIFHGMAGRKHRSLLFNLRDDIEETNNMAAKLPQRVEELSAMLDDFLKATAAVTPVPNPAFDQSTYHPENEGKVQAKRKEAEKSPTSKSPAPSADANASDPALQGWKARACRASVEQGILKLSGLSQASFLGFAAGKHRGPTIVRFKIKATDGSQPLTAHVDWLPEGVQGKAQSVNYRLNGNHWEEVTVSLPAADTLGIIRVYLPKQTQPIEIDWIEIKSSESNQFTHTGF